MNNIEVFPRFIDRTSGNIARLRVFPDKICKLGMGMVYVKG